jgi:hypothetical protein
MCLDLYFTAATKCHPLISLRYSIINVFGMVLTLNMDFSLNIVNSFVFIKDTKNQVNDQLDTQFFFFLSYVYFNPLYFPSNLMLNIRRIKL